MFCNWHAAYFFEVFRSYGHENVLIFTCNNNNKKKQIAQKIQFKFYLNFGLVLDNQSIFLVFAQKDPNSKRIKSYNFKMCFCEIFKSWSKLIFDIIVLPKIESCLFIMVNFCCFYCYFSFT